MWYLQPQSMEEGSLLQRQILEGSNPEKKEEWLVPISNYKSLENKED